MRLLFHDMKIVSFLCILAGGLGAAAAEPLLELARDDVVVFLGGTDMVRAQRSGHLVTLLPLSLIHISETTRPRLLS